MATITQLVKLLCFMFLSLITAKNILTWNRGPFCWIFFIQIKTVLCLQCASSMVPWYLLYPVFLINYFIIIYKWFINKLLLLSLKSYVCFYFQFYILDLRQYSFLMTKCNYSDVMDQSRILRRRRKKRKKTTLEIKI